jgi:hypothetical protein
MIVANERDEELYHHGIVGQKWYIRRYQNPDGSLTDLGRKRYSKSKSFRKKINTELKKMEEAKRAAETPEQKRARLLKSNNAAEIMRDVGLLSTDEVRDRVNRLKVEKELASFVQKEPTKTEKFATTVNKAAKGVDDAIRWTQTPTGKIITKQIKKSLGIKSPKVDYEKLLGKLDTMSNDEIQQWGARLKTEEKMRSNIRSILKSYESADNQVNNGNNISNENYENIMKAIKELRDEIESS